MRPLSQGLQRVHLEASLRDPAASRRTGAMIGELVKNVPASRTACTVGAGSESSGESSVTEPCPEGPPAGESPSSEEPVSPATEVEHDLPPPTFAGSGGDESGHGPGRIFRLRRNPVARLRNILSLFRVEAPNRDENVTRLDCPDRAPSVTPPLGLGAGTYPNDKADERNNHG